MSSRPANVAVLGATGSIGRSTLDVIGRHPDRFRAYALTANTQSEELFELCVLHRPRVAVLADPQGAEALRRRLAGADVATEVLAGEAGLVSAAARREVDVVMAAIVGAAGLAPTLAAAHAGMKLLLAFQDMRGRIEEEIVRYLWWLRPVVQADGGPVAPPAIPPRAQPRRQALNYNNPAEVSSVFAPGRAAAPPQGPPAEFGGAPKPARVVGDDAPIKTVKREEPKIGRNDPCWCGSGKKYKKCHGAA